MAFGYTIYGLKITSDRMIPGVPWAEPNPQCDVIVVFSQPAPDHLMDTSVNHWVKHPRFADRRTTEATESTGLRVYASDDGTCIRLHYTDDAIFTILGQGEAIYVQPPEGMSMESVCAYLLNPVLALCIRLRGGTVLHASAVGTDAGAVLFVAPSGYGKSTMAYEFARRGSTIFSDDVSTLCQLKQGLGVAPAYPHLRLWGWTVEELMGSENALPLIAPDWDKRFVDLREARYRFAEEPMPIRAVFLLEGFSDAISIVQVPPSRALIHLMQNTYLYYMLDHVMRADDFRWLSQLTARVPVFSLVRPADITRLDQSADAVLAQLATLPRNDTGR